MKIFFLFVILQVAITSAVAQTPVSTTLPPAAPASAPASTDTQAPRAIPDSVEPLPGTLFFSREQRERLDRARKRGEVIEDGIEAPPETPPVINGFLRRADGKTIVWVDGKAYPEGPEKLAQKVQAADVGGGVAPKISILPDAPQVAVKRAIKPRAKIPPKPSPKPASSSPAPAKSAGK